MRVGQNPLKQACLEAPPRVVVLVITHLPNMDGYHAKRLDVVKKSLWLLTNNAYDDHILMIWDNDSCDELVEFLQDFTQSKSKRDTLILSRNIGKTNALKSVMRMLPPDTILAYGDDDIEYMPNWLQPQIEILETYPNVGTVTGFPVRLASKWGEASTLAWAQKHAQIETSKFIPVEWEQDYCASVGRDYHQYATATASLTDTRITYKGVQAYAMSQHCQYVCYPERVEPLIQWTDKAMAEEIPFDKAVDAAGMLRLSTVERFTRHMGNVLDAVQIR
jgi:glycosyltransferase involved in cell wall biosynthesis